MKKRTPPEHLQPLTNAAKPLFTLTELDLVRFGINNYLVDLNEKEKATGEPQPGKDIAINTLDLLHNYAESVEFTPVKKYAYRYDLKTIGDESSSDEHKKKVAELHEYFKQALELPLMKDLIVSWIVEPKRLKIED